MGDIFKEQIVKKEPTTRDALIRTGLIVLNVIVAFASFAVLAQFAIYVIAAAVFGTYYFLSTLNREYEYIYTNGELDIDVIYGRTRRKRLFTGDARSFEVCAHINDKMHSNDFNSASETKDYSSGKIKDNTYVFLASYKGKKQKIVFEPNETIVAAMAQVMTTRKFFKKM